MREAAVVMRYSCQCFVLGECGLSKVLEHTATQEACAETTLFFVLKSGYLDSNSCSRLRATNPLVEHLAHTMSSLRDYDFGWLRAPDKGWAAQTTIEAEHKRAMLACLCHYDLDVSLLMRFLGGNYVGAHRDVKETAKVLRHHGVPDNLVGHYR